MDFLFMKAWCASEEQWQDAAELHEKTRTLTMRYCVC